MHARADVPEPLSSGLTLLLRAVLVVVALLSAAAPGRAQRNGALARQGEEFDDVEFKLRASLAPGEAVFVLGDLAELGADELVDAVRLVSADGLAWRVPIRLPADRDFTYRYWRRSARIADLGDATNGEPLTAELHGRTRASLKGPGTKSFQAHTALHKPLLHWRQDQGAFHDEPLVHVGPGRASGEARCGLRAFATGRKALEFYLTSADGLARDPADASRTYLTPLDDFFLQDGELYTYVPAPGVTPMHRAYAAPFTIDSAVLGERRSYRVMLPRGYDEHSDRRYPVLYQYDGANMWDEPFPPYGIWDRDGKRMAALVASGEVGEMIQVAIEYIDDPVCVHVNRGHDCLSPEDRVDVAPCGFVTGMADRFVTFLVSELKPHVDASWRTLPDREHTFATGYSFGGVFALYCGWEFTDTFSAVASQSGSFWVPAFPARVMTERRANLRVYLDTGDLEDSISGPGMRLRNNFLLTEGRVLERDLRFRIGYGQTHTYSNGGKRMRDMLTFLWPATREECRLTWP